jgi:peptidoglycan/xylan/chitin deacetylase (PgdA/CDA1 family)
VKAILTYHSIDESGSVVSVGAERFRSHLRILGDRGVPILPLTELLDPRRDRGVAITFDDGFVNFAETAWPALAEYDAPATVFVATDWVGRENAWDEDDGTIPRLPLMDWSLLADLARDGLGVGSHSRTHRRLTGLADDELVDETVRPRAVLMERLGVDVAAFAYPYGDFDDRVAGAVESAGHTHALTTELQELGRKGERAFALPRLDAYYLTRPGVMEAWGSPRLRRYLAFRHAVRRLRGSLGRLGVSA